ncbi:bifunctional precorrin-2 dehydrogenase/sirohydrochlorin ferrochelatase [Paenibacillus sp. LC-T2]|uniref:precorrin-2 dehydrogenase n=2 Tax=Paenibacillus monticola TaxID=2666075 RepID=A0A7X2L4C8_9BACL|nr:NAD(P)-dependent oxidoreductase [Paenibacillus monticola]MRN56215.1 bifunctional precorrin-2 dehydrogenase/sirohydrochlorin ferrochelatase [Paenibacillus monticola]
MLDCEGQRCVVIGGGIVAERKVLGLLETSAEVTVISPDLTPRLSELAEKLGTGYSGENDEPIELTKQGRLTWLTRCYVPGDARGAFLVYAASNDRAVNEAVAHEARSLGIPVNVVSHAEAGSFITPGVLRRGRLTVAISTSGAGPSAAGQIKSLLEEVLGAEYELYLEFLHKMRTEIKLREAASEVRGRLLSKLGTLDVLNEIRQGTFTEWTPEFIDGWIAANRER